MIKRREFITLLGGAAAAWPLTARAQQLSKRPIIGILGPGNPASHGQFVSAFVQRLRQLGWLDGNNATVVYRWTENRNERAAEIAAEYAKLPVDLIFTSSPANVLAAKQATSTIPIVFAAASDPVAVGLVASLAHPGGNVTGFSIQQIDTVGKRVEILHEVVPALRRLAVFSDFTHTSINLEFSEIETAGRKLGIKIVRSFIRQADEIAPAFEALKGRADAVYVCATPLVTARQDHINALALGARLPTMHNLREYVHSGGLMSYGPNLPDLFRRAADHVDKILRGAKPADIPIEQPTKFDFVINLKTAKALGFDIPPMLLARADEVIE
jgi:putative tryptophan/tyrosine transport system substrate-binding protein